MLLNYLDGLHRPGAFSGFPHQQLRADDGHHESATTIEQDPGVARRAQEREPVPEHISSSGPTQYALNWARPAQRRIHPGPPTGAGMIYALFPRPTSPSTSCGPAKQNTVFATGKSILNRSSSKTHVGNLMLEFGGGGHAAAAPARWPTRRPTRSSRCWSSASTPTLRWFLVFKRITSLLRRHTAPSAVRQLSD